MDSKKIPTKKKPEIVEISKNLIDEKGVNNVSIRDIVKNVGMAQGLFYYYFKSKEEILEIIRIHFFLVKCYLHQSWIYYSRLELLWYNK